MGNESREFSISRLYNAPVAAVWEAWIDPKRAAHWWGPRGFTITTLSKDLRPGGHWHYTMHGPDGKDYPNRTYYHEVEKYSKLVYDHGANDHQPPLFKVTVTFYESDKKTIMNMTMTCESAEKATEIKRFIKAANGNSTWDRLAEYLEKEVNGIEKFVINQTFEAPIELLFKLWTYPEHLQKWISPEGTEMKFIEAQIKEGGASFYTMFNKNFKLFGKSRYLKIKAPNFISYTQQFCDEAGKTSRHPMAPTWPETMMTTVAFVAESPERTRVTVESEVSGKASKEETDTFLNSRAGMTMGWTGSFNKLEKYLSVAKNQSD